mmetsp:Transcript_2114/g.4095  ORF Transcript_2114/g.4095 Transcript_2114/m.4095 type:complete len:86 (-) Transcript_2114:312-569(-)
MIVLMNVHNSVTKMYMPKHHSFWFDSVQDVPSQYTITNIASSRGFIQYMAWWPMGQHDISAIWDERPQFVLSVLILRQLESTNKW